MEQKPGNNISPWLLRLPLFIDEAWLWGMIVIEQRPPGRSTPSLSGDFFVFFQVSKREEAPSRS